MMNGKQRAGLAAFVVLVALAFVTQNWVLGTVLGIVLALGGIWLFLNPDRAKPGGGARGSAGGGREPLEPTDVDR